MALYKLDPDGKPIKPGERRKPDKNKDGLFHWRYQVRKSKKHPRDMTRHFWAKEEDVQNVIATFWDNKPIETANGLKWTDAFKWWQDGNKLATPDHITTVERNIRYLCEYFENPDLTIEETTKGMFRMWLKSTIKSRLKLAVFRNR